MDLDQMMMERFADLQQLQAQEQRTKAEQEAEKKLQREMKQKNIGEEYQELYRAIKAVQPDLKPTQRALKDCLMNMALNTPELLAKMTAQELGNILKAEAVEKAVSDAIEQERGEMAETKRAAELAQRRYLDGMDEANREKYKYISKTKELDKRERELNEHEAVIAELEDELGRMETPEARDRFRMYKIYRRDVEETIKSPQNNTAFIAASATLLAGVPISMSGETTMRGEMKKN